KKEFYASISNMFTEDTHYYYILFSIPI
ncbi:unnamed protein product, partial [Allacma fusca]